VVHIEADKGSKKKGTLKRKGGGDLGAVGGKDRKKRKRTGGGAEASARL